MDLLSELLCDVHIAASAIGRFVLDDPFHLRLEYGWPISFIVLAGRCGWRDAAGSVQWLGPGDAVLALREHCFHVASDFALPATPIDEAWQANRLATPHTPEDAGAPIRFRWGGSTGGARCELLAIAYSFAGGLRHPLFLSLPDSLLIPARDARQNGIVQGALAFLNSEGEEARPGFAAMAAHLAETLFLGLLRSSALQRGHDHDGLASLHALHDARLHAALSALHAEPSRQWTVQALAAAAAMSRSAFAQRFGVCLGMPPMAYVAALRMHLARRRLEAERVPIGLLAEQLGYRSERAFRQAFQRSAGSSPREWRRRRGEPKGPP